MAAVGQTQQPIGDLIVLCDAGDIIRFVNRGFARFFGANAADWHGRAFAPAGPGDEPGETRRFRTTANGPSGPSIIDWRLDLLPSGEKLYVGRPIKDNRRENAETEARHGSRMRFFATVSHEMRTPLNGIIGMTALLLDSELSPNQRAYVEAVKQSGDSLLTLINDILDLSKLDAGKLELECAHYDPHALAQSVVELLAPRAAEKRIEIACFVDPKTPHRLTGDEARLRQILLNLAGNAVKFTDTGGVSIEVSADSVEGQARLLCVVRDTGVGIPSDRQAMIFEEFVQADGDAARRAEGTGLGLAIALRLARAMGGDIALTSAPAQGSVFTVSVAAGPAVAAAEAPLPAAPPVVLATKSAILARTTGLQLAAAGVRSLITVRTIDEAESALRREQGAMLLCDFDLAQEIASAAIRAAARAIVLAPAGAREAIDALRAKGFESYLIKPVRQATLQREIALGPARLEPESRPARASAPAPRRALSILLAEDNRINAVLATTLIRRAGHRVDVAINGAEAAASAAAGGYDLVFMDMHMPEVDGLEASRRIRALGGPAGAVPIVALTANATASDRQKCLAAGMNDFLSKPFEPADLEAMFAKWAGAPILDAAS
jgi:signal transduction histidine kinase/response regulator of citrate/malate metabolism